MKKVLLAVSVSILIFTSCSNENKTSDKATSNQETEVQQAKPEKAVQETSTSKWQANPETAEGMLMIKQIVKNFWETAEENRNYAMTGQELSYQTDYIIKNCNMKGEDHDQLHLVLEPLLKEISVVVNAASYEEADKSLKEIEKLVTQFEEKFEVKQPA